MADRELLVYVDLDGVSHRVGRLWSHWRRNRESATFEYDHDWLAHAERFALEPALALGPGPFHTAPGRALFGAIGDSAPDRWGRTLMRRAERHRARAARETPRTLCEIDFLLMVDDEARQGALRFAEQEGGPFLAAYGASRIPPLIELPRLLAAAEHVIATAVDNVADDLRLLLAPGSSLGGARPKASIRDRDGELAIAKFPHQGDEWDQVRWEAVALALARRAGITVPHWRLEEVAGRKVLILRRFDRQRDVRIPYLSAMSMLGAQDNEHRSYLEIVDALRRHGAHAKADMRELWRRIVFTVLISNTDDHLRNHGFLYAGPEGWTLSPAFDLNPVPRDVSPRVLSTAIDLENTDASLALAYEIAAYCGLTEKDGRAIAGEVGAAVAGWRDEAQLLGLSQADCTRMASAFEHEDLEAARTGRVPG